jgi:hypothetical protein
VKPDAKILICVRVADAKMPAVNSTLVHCEECSQACWLSAETAGRFPDVDRSIICTGCFFRHQHTGGGGGAIEPPTDAELRAARRYRRMFGGDPGRN